MTLSALRPCRSLIATVLLVALSASSVQAASIYKPQDTKGAIASYDLLGVKLGMSEAEAVAAIRKRFPPGSKDANDRPINLKQSDYELTSPATGAKVKAGIRFDLHPETKSNFDFVKVFVHEGKVWAVWRDDASPDGHFKFPHLWPVKLPRAGRPNYGSTAALSAMREAASLRR